MVVTANIIGRTFFIRYKENTGTAFTYTHNNYDFLISAKHIFKNIKANDTVQIFHDGKWKKIDINPQYFDDEFNDIIVFPLMNGILHSDLQIYSENQIILGDDVYFLGFPYGLKGDSAASINNNFPVAFIKKGIISSISVKQEKKYNDYIWVDGHGNHGFSGGPVLKMKNNKVYIIGICSTYYLDQKEEDELTLLINENSGLFYSFLFSGAITLMDAYIEKL